MGTRFGGSRAEGPLAEEGNMTTDETLVELEAMAHELAAVVIRRKASGEPLTAEERWALTDLREKLEALSGAIQA